MPSDNGFQSERIEESIRDAARFHDALIDFVSGYTMAQPVTLFSVVAALETTMADVIASVPEDQREVAYRVLDIRKRVAEREKKGVLRTLRTSGK